MLAIREMSWIQRGAVVLLVLWLVVEVPIVCHHGPLNLFDLGAHEGHIQLGVGPSVGRTAVPPSGSSISIETAPWVVFASPDHKLAATTAFLTVTVLSEGMLPTLPLTLSSEWGLAFIAVFFLLRRLLPLPLPDQPPRPLSPTAPV